MEFVKNTAYNAYCYAYNIVYGQPEVYDCDPQQATIKLKASISTIFYQIEQKKMRACTQLEKIQKEFQICIFGDDYTENHRREYARLLANAQHQVDVLNSIQHQIQKINQMQQSLIANRMDQKLFDQCIPTIENIVFAAQFESSFLLKLNTFTEFLEYLWGKAYVIQEGKNSVEPEFKALLTKINDEKEIEEYCSQFCEKALIMPSAIYRCQNQSTVQPNQSVVHPNQQ